MSDKVPKLIAGLGWRYDTEHSMLRRMQDHDYRSRCIYMLTLTTEGRQPLLGTLCCEGGSPDTARIEPSALGQEVQQCWLQIPAHYPGVKPLAFQLMPDHIHGLLFVTREQQAHLGTIVNGFKVGCNRAFRIARQGLAKPNQVTPAPSTQPTGSFSLPAIRIPSLWAGTSWSGCLPISPTTQGGLPSSASIRTSSAW